MLNNKLNYIFLIILSIAWTLVSCATHKVAPQEIEGIYKQKELGTELILKKDSFLLINTYKDKHLSIYECCDTITYGTWKLDKKLPLLIFSNTEELNSSDDDYTFTFMNIEEKTNKTVDSIFFCITNPLEKLQKKTGKRYIEYQLLLTSNNTKLDDSIAQKIFYDNTIILPKINNLKIYKFEIIVGVNCRIPIKELEIRKVYSLKAYQVKKINTNIFEIAIPQLNYGFLSFTRLNNDYVKILNKYTLLWDGKKYIKQ